jgi:hypothetical protein
MFLVGHLATLTSGQQQQDDKAVWFVWKEEIMSSLVRATQYVACEKSLENNMNVKKYTLKALHLGRSYDSDMSQAGECTVNVPKKSLGTKQLH